MELRTLVLTTIMEPKEVISWKRAVTMLYENKVNVLEEYDARISSPSVTIHVPAVVQLRRMKARNKASVKFSRPNVYARDGHRCCYCGKKKLPRELNYDHVLPRSRGGKTVWENIVTACKRCNLKKDRLTPREAGMMMHFKPYKPEVLPPRPPLIEMNSAPAIWLPYLAALQQTA